MNRRQMMWTGLAAGTVGGCNTPARLASLPEKLRGMASFHGMPAGTRIVLDGSENAQMGEMAIEALRREIAYAESQSLKDLGPADYLAISGGGDNGAYGAGLLTAWTETGTRPVFKGVTGVSTGALIAPFAFLGSDYDKDLERFYTTIEKSSVMTSRGLVSALLGDSLYDSTPLLHIIRSVMTPEMVATIGREYAQKGRILCVATTNLDIPVGVLWNIGGIAASGNREAPELIAKILLASASIPGAFPPVMLDVDAGDEHFQEMHVDGGTAAQVVLYPPSFGGVDFAASDAADAARIRRLIAGRKRHLYVIRNSRPGPDLQTVDRSTIKIAGRAVATLISTQGIGDLYQLYVICQRDGIDYNVTWIPDSFTEKPPDLFDRQYMNKLYQFGRAAMKDNKAWSKYPPGYDPTPLSQITAAVR